MLYVCVPTHNEAVTVGVLLWRLRTVLREQAGGRDYEVVVYDDASTDATAEVLAPYARVLPLTLLRGGRRIGQAGAVDALVRHVVARARAPEADAVVLMQADYTDAPELLPALLAPFDAGADMVLTRRPAADDQPPGERRLRRTVPLLLPPVIRPAVRDAAARDPVALVSFLRLFRASVLRDALGASGGAPLVTRPGWAGTAELVVRTAPFAHRIERVDAPARYDVRTRPSRIDWLRELRTLAATLWQSRGGPARHRAGEAAGSAVRDVSVPPERVPARAAAAPSVTPSTAAVDEIPTNASRASAPDVVEPADTADERAAAAAQRTPRRRRRGRGRTGAAGGPALTLLSPSLGGDVGPAPAEDVRDQKGGDGPAEGGAGDAHNTPADEPSDVVGEPGDASAPDAPRKRRRRRGGARRRSHGSEAAEPGTSERDVGVRPESADVDPATWQGTPSQRATSDQPPS